MEWRDRICHDPSILMGKPTIRGTRLGAGFVLDLLAQGWMQHQILDNYPQLKAEDIQAVLAYSAARLRDEEVFPIKFGT
jgi:uncharacterized protein (DUF433 family)